MTFDEYIPTGREELRDSIIWSELQKGDVLFRLRRVSYESIEDPELILEWVKMYPDPDYREPVTIVKLKPIEVQVSAHSSRRT